jgi:selenocysteine-specific elongation factor
MVVEFEENYGRVLITTLGHVDHGKSTLVKTLTGIDPDRLPEEKVLEGTTDLGFAYFRANNGKLYGFIDVPGHRDYLKNLLTGILNAHFYVLVVDAQEGVMPQTIEHIELVKCLDIKHGLIVISKIDLVPQERIKEVEEEIKLIYADNQLEIPPVVPVSFVNNTGLEELKSKLTECLEKTPPYIKEGTFLLAVMRSFAIAGKGTIVTGPVIKGYIKKGETVFTDGQKSVVREINIFKDSKEIAFTGVTAALNLPDLKVDETRRGTLIVGSDGPEFLSSLDCLVLLRHSKKIKKYMGKKSTSCLMFVLTSYQSAKITFIQNFNNFSICKVKFDDLQDMFSGTPFICYSSDLKELIGTGEILYTNINDMEDKKFIYDFAQNFSYEQYKTSSLYYLVYNLSAKKGSVKPEELELFLNSTDYTKILEDNSKFFVFTKEHIVNIEAMISKIRNVLDEFHKKNPYKYGCKIKDLSDYLQLPQELIKKVVQLMKERAMLLEYNEFYYLPDFKVQQEKSITEEVEKLKKLFTQNMFLTYSKSEINEIFKEEKKIELAFETLKADGDIIHIGQNRWISKIGLEKIKEILYNNKSKFAGGFSPKDLKPFLGDLSRKHLIPILEYLDKMGITKWKGNVRYIS